MSMRNTAHPPCSLPATSSISSHREQVRSWQQKAIGERTRSDPDLVRHLHLHLGVPRPSVHLHLRHNKPLGDGEPEAPRGRDGVPVCRRTMCTDSRGDVASENCCGRGGGHSGEWSWSSESDCPVPIALERDAGRPGMRSSRDFVGRISTVDRPAEARLRRGAWAGGFAHRQRTCFSRAMGERAPGAYRCRRCASADEPERSAYEIHVCIWRLCLCPLETSPVSSRLSCFISVYGSEMRRVGADVLVLGTRILDPDTAYAQVGGGTGRESEVPWYLYDVHAGRELSRVRLTDNQTDTGGPYSTLGVLCCESFRIHRMSLSSRNK